MAKKVIFNDLVSIECDDSLRTCINEIAETIKYVITQFKSVMKKKNIKELCPHPITILIENRDFPMIIQSPSEANKRIIYLCAVDSCWDQYAYQFAHEFCHYIIDGPLDGKCETSFWFEESICEVASRFFLHRLYYTLSRYNNIASNNLKNYAKSFKDYADNEIPKGDRKIDCELKVWIQNNIKNLTTVPPEENRGSYGLIAKELLPIFEEIPVLWNILPYIKRLPQQQYIDFKTFISKTVANSIQQSSSQLFQAYSTLSNLLV